tara:strand:- start:1799 stop:3487 length:1689 start_codon:yes stop_codon:yes gene_type:complete
MANLRANKIYGTSGLDANGSALFNGTDYLTAANAAAFRLNQGSGADFTIEAWIYAKSVGTQFTIASLYHTTGNKRSYTLYVNTDAELKINYSGNGTAANTSVLNAGTIPTNEWIHVAVTHDTSATTLRLFKNGVLRDDDTGAHATWYANTDGDFVVGSSLDGFISNLHINKGTCKYTAAFDPYKQPIEVETNTSVLCCNSSTDALNDDKSNTFVQTASDGVKPTSDMPFSRSDAGVVFDGETKINSQSYMYFPTGDTSQRGRGRGLFGGGYYNPGIANSFSIQYVDIQSLGNSKDFGDLKSDFKSRGCSSCASSTRGLFGGGYGGSPLSGNTNTIEYVTIATTSNSIDFGDMTIEKERRAALSNNTRGIFGGGSTDPTSPTNTVNTMGYVTIATLGNATDFGDLTEQRGRLGAIANTTRGLFFQGNKTPANNSNVIDYVTIATTGDATNFGDCANTRSWVAGVASSTRGVLTGGNASDIEYVTIATTGNATDFGDLSMHSLAPGAVSNGTRGVINISYSSGKKNNIEYVTIATTGNSKDFGDMDLHAITTGTACSDSHGGIS